MEKATKQTFANIDTSYPLEEGAEDLVIFRITDYSSPQPKDITKPRNFQVRKLRLREEEFVQYFKSNFENNGAFQNVNTAEKIYRALKNITKEHIEERYDGQISSATSVPSERRILVNNLLDKKRKLFLNGSMQIVTIEGFINVPGLNKDQVDVFPEDI